MVITEVDRIGGEGQGGQRLEIEVHESGHVRDQGLAVEPPVDDNRGGQVSEGTRESTRVGEETVGTGAGGALSAGVGVVVEHQAAT